MNFSRPFISGWCARTYDQKRRPKANNISEITMKRDRCITASRMSFLFFKKRYALKTKNTDVKNNAEYWVNGVILKMENTNRRYVDMMIPRILETPHPQSTNLRKIRNERGKLTIPIPKK
jgi:hypothetical protein